jgi:hypothetical protein
VHLSRSTLFGIFFPIELRLFFQRFWFGFWDERRMVDLGFMAPADEQFTDYRGIALPGEEQIWCLWASLLSHEQFDGWMRSPSPWNFYDFVDVML